MNTELLKLLDGAIAGGIVAALFRVIEKRIELRSTQSAETHRTLAKYAKPLWLACHDLEQRFEHLQKPLKNPRVLTPPAGQPLDWYTKEGYYVTSTAYLLASVSAWISLFQRDVLFLEFKHGAVTGKFFRLIEKLKTTLSETPSSLWYLYVNAIGEQLLPNGDTRPITYAMFIHKLKASGDFRLFYDQLFQYLKQVPSGKFEHQIGSARRLLGLSSASYLSTRQFQNLNFARRMSRPSWFAT